MITSLSDETITTARELPLTVRTIVDLDDSDGLADSWRQLGTQFGPIEQYEWAVACAAYRPDKLRIVALGRGDDLAAVLPLCLSRISGVRRWAMLGVQDHYERMDVLAADSEALARLADELSRSSRPCVFGRLPVDSPAVDALTRSFSRRSLVLTRPQIGYPYIPLDDSWRQPEEHLNSGRRSDLRRARRKAEKLGTVTFEAITPEMEQLDELLDEAFEVEARSWKGAAGTAMSCDPADVAFFRQYAQAICRQGNLRICRLRIGERTVAVQIAIIQGGGFWLLKIGYDAEYSGCSPGMLLLRDSIAYAANASLSTFEFLGRSESWIEVWTSHKRDCVAIRTYPHNPFGMAALAADVSVTTARRIGPRVREAGARARDSVKRCAAPLMNRVSRNYIAGETLVDAVRVAEQLSQRGQAATIGFWDGERDNARGVADQYLAGLDTLAATRDSSYLSVKLPALRFTSELLAEVAARAEATGVRIHFDAMAPDTVERTQQMIDEVRALHPKAPIGFTLPGRWRRSLDDARWCAERGLPVRVVKGQWPDPTDPQRDPRTGYLETIDQLAGKAHHVSVATHEPPLALEAIRRLRAAGTPCDLELLYGLPMRTMLRRARELGIVVRIYVPYGEAYRPYAMSQLRRNPRILGWLLKDMLASLVRPQS